MVIGATLRGATPIARRTVSHAALAAGASVGEMYR